MVKVWKVISRFITILIKILRAFFIEIERIILKFIEKYEDSEYLSDPKPKEQGWGYHSTQFHIIPQSHSKKTAQ